MSNKKTPEEIKKTLLQEMAADELAKSTADENTLRADSSEENAVHKIDPAMKEFFAENRTLNGTATMLIDLDRCTRCDDCVTACASGHNNNPRFVRHGVALGNWWDSWCWVSRSGTRQCTSRGACRNLHGRGARLGERKSHRHSEVGTARSPTSPTTPGGR